ncbi:MULTISPECIES: NAD-dependent epimerase/dehydratase family protein [unclassified Pseudoclavibacter]|uniref:NAD-dependent epimerase/dehydratase family protein n=1 Tax=unclassified Pseudoclavibacter TaxID=2615177 RepID=UPI0013011762|nr:MULTISPECIES: NAD-dependent epimerase/dehydratase family protein [unclassified Pseudoclavibacter]KAB1645578.1 NADP oxidoreductase [Pseudoclavibacter sp. CFCC 14310]KAB1645963.1 NADP oxidoreductase [Pseudoclavibacter sp. CFCC 14310]KAB1663733.1 NADP oxidoreductase [Pseudoclavibacter sp. CFCC 13611]KAB1664518.1 NADP oxidoreductase [Pseudoclavibacter sp. CFCC 13611]
MSTSLIIGAGALGRSTAEHLLNAGHDVVVATRRPLPDTDPLVIGGARSIACDITTPEALAAVRTLRLSAIVACCNWPYPQWSRMWPRATQQLIAIAAQHDASLTVAGNLYPYALGSSPLGETSKIDPPSALGRVRAEVWETLFDAHKQGRIRATEIRGSDYLGAGAGAGAHAGDRLVVPVLSGAAAHPIGDPDQPHTWTAIRDFGRLLARAVQDEHMWGRVWHVPSAPACAIRDVAQALLDADVRLNGQAAQTHPRLQPIPGWLLTALGLFSPMMRQLGTVAYQFTEPFVLDDSAARNELGEQETPWAETIEDMVRDFHTRRSVSLR